MVATAHFVWFVADQGRATAFYQAVLQRPPRLQVPGMTEFELAPGAVLGLMPNAGIRRLLGAAIVDPAQAGAPPRAELYLLVDDPERALQRALAAGARLLSTVCARDWGHRAGYCADLDGHVVAFAAPN